MGVRERRETEREGEGEGEIGERQRQREIERGREGERKRGREGERKSDGRASREASLDGLSKVDLLKFLTLFIHSVCLTLLSTLISNVFVSPPMQKDCSNN